MAGELSLITSADCTIRKRPLPGFEAASDVNIDINNFAGYSFFIDNNEEAILRTKSISNYQHSYLNII